MSEVVRMDRKGNLDQQCWKSLRGIQLRASAKLLFPHVSSYQEEEYTVPFPARMIPFKAEACLRCIVTNIQGKDL